MHVFSKPATKKRASAFTLIELSIALVIIGLLVGGVLVGRDMIKAAELRGVLSQIERIDVAVSTFKLKYNCLPGDCAAATNFFPSSGCPNGNGDPTATCNGNGNGYVDSGNSGGGGTTSTRREHLRFWQHLALAGLIEGQYTGVGGPGDSILHVLIGVNTPETPVSGLGISLWHHLPSTTTWTDNYGVNWGTFIHVLIVGAEMPSNRTSKGKLTVQQVRSLDNKVDDGLANNGWFRVRTGDSGQSTLGCTSGAAPNYSYGTNQSALCSVRVLKKW